MQLDPYFSGPVVAMGAYSVEEVLNAPPRTVHATGIASVDDLCGGIGAGELWAVRGPAGVGVSTVLEQLARTTAASTDVVLLNGHVPTRLLALRVSQSASPLGRLRVGSFITLPAHLGELWEPDLRDCCLCLIDTWDEQYRDAWWTGPMDHRVFRARMFRESLRIAQKAAVVSLRLLDHSHGLSEVVDDVADVVIDVGWSGDGGDDPGSGRLLTVTARGRGRSVGSVKLAHDGTLVVCPSV